MKDASRLTYALGEKDRLLRIDDVGNLRLTRQFDQARDALVEANTSGPEWVEVDGAKFTKPAHMLPRPDYNAMYGGPDNNFWVIPSGRRVR